MSKITHFFTELMRRYLPDPFVFAILLTLLTMVLAFVVEGRTPLQTTMDWGNGFWQLLSFTTQMAVILAMGYVLAAAPLVDRSLNWLLPALAISRLKLQNIMGYTVVMMIWVGVVYMAAILAWPHMI